jgi:UDP-glucose 4-epimerase
MDMKILVVGGAGYIGSHMVRHLLAAGHHLVVLDNLSSGRRSAVVGGGFVQGDLANGPLVAALFSAHRFDAVFHFASFIEVGESLSHPAKYYRNNFANTLNLVDAMVKANVKKFVFSSSAAIFGEPERIPIDEDHPCRPVNAYGRSKLMVEQALQDYDRAYRFRSICLRYFNAAGADPAGKIGECHEPETHLIPLLLQVASGRRDCVKIFGRDYDTPDGTCIRDFVHVEDLCHAHLQALNYLVDTGRSETFNLGSGEGFSVQEVLSTVERITGRSIRTEYAPRRVGDPARLVADPSKATRTLGWKAQYGDLDTIVAHAWAWEKKLVPSADSLPCANPTNRPGELLTTVCTA